MKKVVFFILLFAHISALSTAQNRQVILPQKPVSNTYKDYSSDVTPFWFGVEAEGGSSIMEFKPNMQYVSVNVIGGYRFSEFMRLGIGFGGRAYVHNADVRDTRSKFGIPLFINARGNMLSAYDRDGVPYWSVNVGTVTHEAFYFNPTIGYSFGGLRNNFLIGLSYTLSTFKDYTKTNRVYSYFGLKLGYEY